MSASGSAQPRRRSQAKLVFFAVFGALTVFVTYMKNAGVLDPADPMARHYGPAAGYLVVHAVFGALALLLGACQLSNRLRARYLGVHRKLGYVYVAGVLVAAPFAIPVAARIDTPSLAAASIVQAFGWLGCTLVALYCVRRGNIVQHRRWMIRGYAFAMVFTVARLVIPIPPVLAMHDTGVEIVVWSAIALAAFLPSIVLDWRSIVKRPAVKQTMESALELERA